MKYKRSYISPRGTATTLYATRDEKEDIWTLTLVDWEAETLEVLGQVQGFSFIEIFCRFEEALENAGYDPIERYWVQE